MKLILFDKNKINDIDIKMVMFFYLGLVTMCSFFILFIISLCTKLEHNVPSKEEIVTQCIKHIDEGDKVIIKYQNKQYNITNFLDKHPGGRAILISNNGNDVEELMKENGHSSEAYKLLKNYEL